MSGEDFAVVVEDEEGITVPVYPVSSLSSLSAQSCGDSSESIRPAGISMQTRSTGGRNCLRRRMCGCFLVLSFPGISSFPICATSSLLSPSSLPSPPSFSFLSPVSVTGILEVLVPALLEVSISVITIIPTLSADTFSRVDVSSGRKLGIGRVDRSAASYVRGVESGADGCVYLSLMEARVSEGMSECRCEECCGMSAVMKYVVGQECKHRSLILRGCSSSLLLLHPHLHLTGKQYIFVETHHLTQLLQPSQRKVSFSSSPTSRFSNLPSVRYTQSQAAEKESTNNANKSSLLTIATSPPHKNDSTQHNSPTKVMFPLQNPQPNSNT